MQESHEQMQESHEQTQESHEQTLNEQQSWYIESHEQTQVTSYITICNISMPEQLHEMGADV